MKKTYIAFLIATLSLALSSCEHSFLEPWPPDAARQAEDIWGNYYYTKGVLDRAYTGEGLCSHWNEMYGPTVNGAYTMSPLACATDEAEHTLPTARPQIFTNGNWNINNTPTTYYGSRYNGHNARHPWINSYLGMRRLHLFLDNVDHSVLINDPDDPTRAHDLTYWRGQAFYLRAWFGFEILKRYGGYPISLHTEEIDETLYRPRNTLDECVAQIVADLDSAAEMLPALWDEENWHRANRMFAQALKSRVLLYYASPLYQGDFWSFGLNKGEVGDVNRWVRAADAAREAINNNVSVKGYKVVEGRSKRVFTDLKAVVDTAMQNGYTDLYKKELISLTEFEKLMGKKRFTELLGPYVAKPPGKLALVPDSDPRPPVERAESPEQEFSVLPAQDEE